MSKMQSIGRVEYIDLPSIGLRDVPAKIDTGADLSAIWASDIREQDGVLKFVLFAANSPFFTGKILEFHHNKYTITRVANSFGHKEIRYRVKLSVRICGKLINGTFTLADRSAKIYPVLIGRKLLNNKFIVDVSKGKPLKQQERIRKFMLKQDLEELL